MNLSPLDIRKHEFKKTLRGYDVDEVTAFMDMVSMEYETLVRENALLNEKVNEYTSQLKKYHDIESILQETLLSAERAREETVNIAKKQAEVIVRESEVKAASIIEEGRKVFSSLRNAVVELQVQKEAYLSKIKALINAQLDIFDKFSFSEEEKFKDVDAILGDESNSQKELKFSSSGNMMSDLSPGNEIVPPENDEYSGSQR